MPEGRQRRRKSVQKPAQRAIFWLAWWLVCFVLWMLLVFKTEPLEFVAGALAAALAATAAELVRSRGYAPFAGELRWLLSVARLPREVLVDCFVLARALWRQLTGKQRLQGTFRVIHFEGCGGEDPRSEARRAVAKWLGAVGPNTYVIGFDEERDIVLVHQLVPTKEPPDVDPGSRRG
jgi:multisubunit Na+/H+ antiporter MnhE subunit